MLPNTPHHAVGIIMKDECQYQLKENMLKAIIIKCIVKVCFF